MTELPPSRELSHLLRAAGGGMHLVSTGLEEQRALQKDLYRVDSAERVDAAFRESLERIAEARVVVFGVPSDVGAGFMRGASLGPGALRRALLQSDPEWPERAAEWKVLDIGDVFVVPQLLHDDMLSETQLAATRRALYGSLPPQVANRLPVSPLSMAERALDLVARINPRARPFVIGGDHSNAWPVASALSRHRADRWGIVQPDAHTDLLAERLGIRYCFATWSYHANELLGRDGRLVQVGTRASRFDRHHWESTLRVRQFWAAECRADPAGSLDALFAHLAKVGVSSVYFSNDIDGTDESYADATGTPEPNGLEPDFVIELIRRLGQEVGLCAGDLMEVAPPVQRTATGADRTLALGARYMRETIEAMVHGRDPG